MRLVDQRCLNHPGREAAVRCPGCRRFFCRECVTEHAERWLCADCLRRGRARLDRRRPARVGWGTIGQAATALLLAWLFFYGVGKALVAVPVSVHEGTFGRENPMRIE